MVATVVNVAIDERGAKSLIKNKTKANIAASV